MIMFSILAENVAHQKLLSLNQIRVSIITLLNGVDLWGKCNRIFSDHFEMKSNSLLKNLENEKNTSLFMI